MHPMRQSSAPSGGCNGASGPLPSVMCTFCRTARRIYITWLASLPILLLTIPPPHHKLDYPTTHCATQPTVDTLGLRVIPVGLRWRSTVTVQLWLAPIGRRAPPPVPQEDSVN